MTSSLKQCAVRATFVFATLLLVVAVDGHAADFRLARIETARFVLAESQSTGGATSDCGAVEGHVPCGDKTETALPIENFIPAFECVRVNSAWGFTISGTALGTDGRIVTYKSHQRDFRAVRRQNGSDSIVDAAALAKQFARATLRGSIEAASVQEHLTSAAAAAGTPLERTETGARDAGSSACHAYIAMSDAEHYRDVDLGSDGGAADFRLLNPSPAAKAALEWLKSVGVAVP